MPRPFQFSVRTLLESTGFVALAAGCWHLECNSDLIVGFAIPIFVGAAIGHLFGDGPRGAMMGLGVVVVLLVMGQILSIIQRPR
ncbi:MAG TPA: hypothetical protein VHC22_29235 [Pirellulales bacterium]|nr:hypothetical protein [Pirellulales bacterium]